MTSTSSTSATTSWRQTFTVPKRNAHGCVNSSVRLPNLRFEVEDMIIEGGPWSTRVATRYAATRNGKVVYRGTNFGRVVWGKVVEERILPDTQALAAALG